MPAWNPDHHVRELNAHAEWEWCFSQVQSFIQERGHADMGDHPAGEWLRRQKQSASLGTLPEGRRQRLQELGVLSEEEASRSWGEMWLQLRTLMMRQSVRKGEERAVWLPSVEEDARLREWLKEQRLLHRKGGLSRQQAGELNRLGLLPPDGNGQADEVAALRRDVWEERFLSLMRFYSRFGHCDVPQNWKEDSMLASWVREQRSQHKKGSLPVDWVRRLDELDFSWDLGKTAKDRVWESRLEELLAYKAEHGHMRVKRQENATLYNWRHIQREWRRKGTLRPERIARLDEVGFDWNEPGDWSQSRIPIHEQRWNRMFDQAAAFHREFGHVELPVGRKENAALAKWLMRQRSLQKQGALPEDRKARLDELGMRWEHALPQAEKRWEDRFAELLAYKAEHGHMRVTERENPHLWNWRQIQRQWRRKGMLKPERIARLDEVGFDWNEPGDWSQSRIPIHEQRWEQMYGQAVAFHREFGHVELPVGRKENAALAKWLMRQRSFNKQGALPEDRKARLDELGMRWEHALPQAEKRWEERFAQLLAFKAEHGHMRVTRKPGEHKDNQLAAWRQIQRLWRRYGKLGPERIARLDAIGFEWDD